MSFEQKKRNELEMDELNIKSHLNTSLEAEGISVSEDLVSRTLNAIRLQEAESLGVDKDKFGHKKPLFFYRNVRTLVTVAAAALILVVGFNAIRMYAPFGMKENMAKSDNSTSDDGAGNRKMYSTKESAPKEDKVAYDMDASDDFESDAQTNGTIEQEDQAYTLEGDKSVDMPMGIKSDEKADENNEADRISSLEYTLTFTDITLMEYLDVSSITISSNSTGEMKTLTKEELIDGFYSVMEKHLFMQATGDDTATQYIIKLTSEDADSQIIIGENMLTVDNTHMGTTSHSIFTTADNNLLLKDLKELLEK
jgi:hypothetical protein